MTEWLEKCSRWENHWWVNFYLYGILGWNCTGHPTGNQVHGDSERWLWRNRGTNDFPNGFHREFQLPPYVQDNEKMCDRIHNTVWSTCNFGFRCFSANFLPTYRQLFVISRRSVTSVFTALESWPCVRVSPASGPTRK